MMQEGAENVWLVQHKQPKVGGSGNTLLRQTQRTKADAHSTPKDLVQKQENS